MEGELNLKMVYGIATCEHPQWEDCVNSWLDRDAGGHNLYTVRHKDILEAYQEIYRATDEPILAHMHDDLVIHEPEWDTRVLKEFLDPSVGVVGFGGAPGWGDPDMYQKPFAPVSLARRGFLSNQRTAARDGSEFKGEMDVVVLDGFALFIRRELLDRVGGWPLGTPIGYFGYDYWVCATALRLGYRIRLVGVDCQHLSGKSTGLNPNLRADFDAAHRYIYDNFRDVLPAWRG